ncbi:MAG: DUF502 domain-containing protein [Opitutae bacterium]|nr:DUF502 domain-containing protein [Opitutae bacterium]
MPESRFTTLRNAFFAGLLLLAPLVVTVWALRKIIDVVGGTFRPVFLFFLPDALRDRPSLSLVWDLLATLVVIALVTLFGYISRYFLGKYFLGVAERAIQSVPGINSVYNTVKQIVETFGGQNRNIFSKVVLVEFPRPGVHAIGFLTNKAQGEAQARLGAERWTVFVPTAPNPTSGFLLLLPRAEITELEMSVGDGMKMVISGGAVMPHWAKTPDAVPPPS